MKDEVYGTKLVTVNAWKEHRYRRKWSLMLAIPLLPAVSRAWTSTVTSWKAGVDKKIIHSVDPFKF